MAIRQYIGARYVPKIMGDWVASTSYEALSIVTYNHSSYTSKVAVPSTVGNPADNSDYWVLTGDYNAQVAQYAQDVANYRGDVEQYSEDVEQLREDVSTNLAHYLKLGYKVVDASGSGDYTTINAALAANPNNAYLIIRNGNYHEKLDFKSHAYVSLIGESREHVIIFYDSGVYKDSTIVTNNNYNISNLTVRALGSASFTPTYDDNNVVNTYPAYAIHHDHQGSSGHGTISNCIISSSAGPSIGSGTAINSTFTIKDCDITRTPLNNSYKAGDTVHEGAVLIHCSNIASDVNQACELINNRIFCSYGYSLVVRGELASSNYFALKAVNNIIISNERKNDCVYYAKGSSTLSSDSGNNTNSLINVAGHASIASPSDTSSIKHVPNVTANWTDISIDYLKANKIFVGMRLSTSYTFAGFIEIDTAFIRTLTTDGHDTIFRYTLQQDGTYAQVAFSSDRQTIRVSTTSTQFTVATIALGY